MALKFRRGTTAQQSGSLAFGEPYVNTTLGTLLVGGPNGDIVLSTTGTGSTGTFGAISGSGLDITGDARIGGNLTLGGNITIGDATTDTVVINADLSSSIIPDTTNTFDVGSPTKLYRNVYANNISASSVEIMSGSNPELRLLNKTTGIAYHLQNGDGGNLTIHNATTSRLAAAFVSSSTHPNVLLYSDLIVSQSIQSSRLAANTITGSLSGSVNGIGNVTDYSASVASKFTTLGTYTASVDGRFSTLATLTGSNATRLTNLETTTASLNTSVSNLNTFSASQLGKDSTLATLTASYDGRFTTLGTYTASVEGRFSTLATLTGSNATRLTALEVETSNLETFSASALTRLTALEVETANLESTTASLNTSVSNLNTFSASENSKNSTLATYTASVDGRFTTIASVTASYDGRFTSLATITGSLISSASNANGRLNAIEAVSGTFARTNSANVFSGNQTITGSLFVSQDLIVAGSSSIQNISSSTLNIGTNLVTVAVNSPSVRFGGLAVIDSGSAGGSGSFLYDSVQDEFIFVHRGNGTNVTSSHFVLGPETYDNLGNENYLTNNRVSKGTGKEHIVDSQISDDGTTVSIPGALTVTGNITGPIRATNGVVSGSSQITYASISSIPSGIVSGAAQLTSILPAGVISGSSQVVGSSITTNTVTIGSTSIALGGTATTIAGLTSVSSTGFTGALTGNASTATTLQTARTINGTSFNGSADITIPNLVSGSSQITAGSTTNFATDVKTQLNSNTVVSGSSQVIGILSSLNTYTGSNDTLNTTQNTRLTALEASASTALSTNNTQATSITNLNSATASLLIETANLESFSASALTRLSNLEGTDITITLTGDVTGTGTITNLGNVSFATTVAANSVALGTDTTGDYVASLVAGTGVTLSNNSGEGATPTIAIGQAVATSSSPTFAGLTINGAITATGDITAFFTSDKRHKNNIQIIPNALEKVSKLNGVTWEWNDDVNEVTKQSPKTGLIAQEVLEVLPEVVKQKEDGFLGLDYSKMIGLLVEAIKEQQSQIEELKTKLGYN